MKRWPAAPAARVFLFLAAILASASGCGDSTGPARYPISGHVNFNGQPVPGGFIYFTPDTTQGGSGPAAGAPIHDGTYATPAGQGTVGGPHIVTIVGHDGVSFESAEGRVEAGRGLFPAYELHIDLPKASSTQDFDVPSTP